MYWGRKEGWKSLSPPSSLEPAGKWSPVVAAWEQKRAGAAVEGGGGLAAAALSHSAACHGQPGKGGEWGGREEAAGELAPSKHLGFIVLGVWPTWWKSLVRTRELLWDAGTGTRHPTRGVMGLSNGNCCSWC